MSDSKKFAKRYTESDHEKWVIAAQEGKSITDISRKFGVSTTTVSYWLNRYGVEVRRDKTRYDHDAIRAMWRTGKYTKAEIARKYGCSTRLVSQITKGIVPDADNGESCGGSRKVQEDRQG